MQNKTTIIALSYNGKEITEKFIELLFKYTEPSAFNLIMIDNGSTDGTKEYLKDALSIFENHTLVINDRNLGVIGGRNMGYSIYQSDPTEFLCFLDNDQFVRAGWFEQYHEFMKSGNYDIVGADAWLMNSSFFPCYNCKRLGDHFSYVGCGGLMTTQSVLNKIGLFDEQFNPAYFEDPDFNFRAIKAGFRIGWNLNAKITHLAHKTLGNDPNRRQLFLNSYSKFKEKWNGKIALPVLRT
jgi:GT2 family glycosyltransferase